MASLVFSTSNISSLSNGSPAYLTGKNGFSTELGVAQVLVTQIEKADLDASVNLTVRGLDNLYDDNSSDHILNSTAFTEGVKQISYRVRLNDEEGEIEEVAYVDPYVFTTSNIQSFYTTNNIISIKNDVVDGLDLYSRLETPPFYVKLFQSLTTTSFSQKSVFVTGSTLSFIKYYNIVGQTGVYTADITLVPENKNFLTVFLDGKIHNEFNWDSLSNISLDLSNTHSNLKVLHKKYTVPVIEKGDNIFVMVNNTYSIINASYIPSSIKYNVSLSANNIFKLYFKDNLKVNATSFTATNISPNPFGMLGNVFASNNSFTLDYSENTYPGEFTLSNNYVYKMVKGNKFTPLDLTQGKSIYDVPTGFVSVRAQNINSSGRKSSFATKSAIVYGLSLPAVENLAITESIYLDTTKGVSVRAVVSFDSSPGKDILAYEISYKIEGENSTVNTYNTVQIPASGVESDGKIRYIINNIDRGRTSYINTLVVRVTPLNNDLTGIPKTIIHSVIGKTAVPYNVQTLSQAQNGNNLTLFWSFKLNPDNTLFDLDLQEVEIRRYSGSLTESQLSAAWLLSTYIATVAIPTTNYTQIINSYGTYTYLVKTRDTSRNDSSDVKSVVSVLERPTNLSAYKTWSEDSPLANDSVQFLTNENYQEYYWPSFANSDNGGFNYAIDDPVTAGVGPSTLTENSNGTSSGFSVSATATDLLVASNAFYQTAVRDLGQIVSGKLTLDINVFPVLASTWLSMRENLVSGVSDASVSSNILWDNGSYIGNLLLSNSAIYDTVNKTLKSSDSYGNVYAIWNSGQFSTDTSNANSFALIAGVINANAIALGHTFFAGGIPSLTNTFTNVATKASSYQLVNLKQWGDAEGLGNWQGPDNVVEYNVELRYSTSNVHFPTDNSNVNVVSFSSSNVGTFDTYNSGDINFRWFQFRLNIINYNSQLASSVFDKFRYTVDLTNKLYQATVNVTANPTIVSFASQNFKSTPIVVLTPVIDVPLRINNTFPSYSPINSNSTQANITVYTNTGAFISGTLVNIQATGY